MDIVFETVGGENYLRSIKATRQGGKVPSIVNPPDEASRKLADEKLIKTDFMLLQGIRKDLEEIADLVDRGIVQPKVFKTIPLSMVVEGLSELESGRTQGKLVACIN